MQKQQLIAFIFAIATLPSYSQSVGIGTNTPNINAILELNASNRGLLLPRLTTNAMIALSSAPDGMIIFNSGDGFLYIRKGAAWQRVSDASNTPSSFSLPFAGQASNVASVFSATNTAANGDGIRGIVNGTGRAVYGEAIGTDGGTGIYGIALNGTAGRFDAVGTSSIAGYFFSTGGPAIVTVGSVGINTQSPAFPLDVNGRMRLRHNGATAGIWYNNALNNATSSFTGQINDTTWGIWDSPDNTWRLAFNHSRGFLGIGSTTPQHPISFSSTLGSKVALYGGNTSPTLAHYGIGIQSSQLQLYVPSSADHLAFGTGSSTTFDELVRFTGTGRVGINSSAPAARLHVVDGGSNTLQLENSTALNTGTEVNLYFKNGSRFTGIIGTAGTGTASARLYFSTFASANANSLTERMSIADNGNVGINTTTPAYRLDVNGLSRFSQKMLVSQNTVLGNDAALELEGGIKTTGPNKFAFRVEMGTLAGNPRFFQVGNIDYYNITTPLIANDPDAVIVATPLSTSLSFPFWVGYDATNTIGGGAGQWYLAEPRNAGTGGFVNGTRFQVIVVKQ